MFVGSGRHSVLGACNAVTNALVTVTTDKSVYRETMGTRCEHDQDLLGCAEQGRPRGQESLRCVTAARGVLLRASLRPWIGPKSMWWNGFDGAFPSKK